MYLSAVYSFSVLFYVGGLVVSEKTEKCLNCEGPECPKSDSACQNESKENSHKDHVISWGATPSPPVACHIPGRARLKSKQCFSFKGEMSCDQPLPVGTLVSFSCPAFYNPKSAHSLCLADGSWTDPIGCTPECGLISPKAELVPLIRYGTEVSAASQWPWIAALYHKINDQWKLNCGGTLISENAIITAAHCVWNTRTRDMLIKIGHLPRDLEKDSGTVYHMKTVFILPIYNHRENNFNSDIAVVILQTPVKFSENVLPACLPKSNSTVSPYTTGVVAGWGTNEKHGLPSTLHYIKIPIVNTTTCLNTVPKGYKKFLSYTTFCAGYTNGTGVCNGDSGNGLLTEVDGRWVLQGVVSNSPSDANFRFCHPNNFAGFTKVKLFVDWIRKAIEIEEKKSTSEH